MTSFAGRAGSHGPARSVRPAGRAGSAGSARSACSAGMIVVSIVAIFLITAPVPIDCSENVFRIFQSAAFQFVVEFSFFVQPYSEAGVLPCIGGLQKRQQSQEASILVPPDETNGNVTPVRGSRSTEPNTLSIVWKINMDVAAQAAIL